MASSSPGLSREIEVPGGRSRGRLALGWAAGVALLAAVVSGLWIFRLGLESAALGLAANGARVLAAGAAGMALGAASSLRANPEAWRFEARLFAGSASSAAGLTFGLITIGSSAGAVLLAGVAGALGYGVVRLLEHPSRLALAAWGAVLLGLFFAGIPAFMGGATFRDGFGGVASFLLGDVAHAHGLGAWAAFLVAAIAVVVASTAGIGSGAAWAAGLRGLAFGIAGPVAFVGGAAAAVARWASPSDRRASPMTAALLGGALLMTAELAGRMAIGGYAPPLNLTLAFFSIPLALVVRGRALARGRARTSRLADLIEWTSIGALALGLLALGAAVTDFVRSAT